MDKEVAVVFCLIVISFILGGFASMVVGSWFIPTCEHIIKNVRLKLYPKHEDIMNTLSDDTQVILKNYMEQFDLWGRTVYIVKNIKKFDSLLQGHNFKKFNYNGCCNLDYCVNENLKEGSGFIILLNGKEYVAIPAPREVDTDSFIK